MAGRGQVNALHLIRWAREQTVERGLGGTEAHVLLLLATYADGDARCYPSLATLARRCGLKASEEGRNSTISAAVASLEDRGLISTRQAGRGKSPTRMLMFDDQRSDPQERSGQRSGLQERSDTLRSDPQDACVPADRTITNQVELTSRTNQDSVPADRNAECDRDAGDQSSPPTRRTADQNALPKTLPSELHSTVDDVLAVVSRVQAERGGIVPTRRGVGLAIAAFPDRDLRAVASELEHWALAGHGQARPVRDWARTYRTFLERSPAASPSRAGAATMQSEREARRARTAAAISELLQPTEAAA